MATKWVSRYPGYDLIEVDPRKLYPIARCAWSRNTERLLPLIQKLEDGGEMDAPIIDFCWVERIPGWKIDFQDGTHRVAAAIYLGFSSIKIAVNPNEREFIGNFLKEEHL